MKQTTIDARKFKVKHYTGPLAHQGNDFMMDTFQKPRRYTPRNARNEVVPNKPRPGDEIDHQRLLRDEYAKRMQKQQGRESERPAPK